MNRHILRAKEAVAGGPTHLNWADSPRSANFAQQPLLNANGGGSIKQSMPYAVTVTNASASGVNNFDVLGSYEYINNAGFQANGDLVIGSITISSAIPGVTYRELLYQAQNNPFTVGMTYLSCANAPAQVQDPFTIVTKDANGTTVTVPIVPAVDPYQQIQSINVVNQVYRIDGFTKLTFSQIQASAILLIRWYPEDNLNPARAISGQPVVRAYGDPNVIRK